MKIRDKILSGILLVLIGVLMGMILMFFRQGSFSFDLAEVKVTEVNRSESPVWTDDELEKIDDRFVFKTIAKSVTPSVVYIETLISSRDRRDTSTEERDGEDDFWDRFLPRTRTVGSGVIITADGYILTNNHVIESAVRDGISVTLEDKRTYDARIVGRDPSTDLAVLKIDAENLQNAVIGNSDRLEVGEWVLAIGNPFRLRSTVTAGIVSALSREVRIIDDLRRIESFIQTDAAINRGNSGGALVNTSGELIGINTAIATQTGSYQGYGFAVPSNLALKISRDLIEFGEVKRGALGVIIESVNASTAQRAGLSEISGVLIVDILEDGAAEKAGVQFSDIILKVNGVSVAETNQLIEKVAMYRPNDEITLTLWRDEEEVETRVVLDEMMPLPQEPAGIPDTFDEDQIDPEPDIWEEIPEDDNSGIEQQSFRELGFSIRALATPEDPDQFNLYLQRVERGSVAWNRGIREGGEITEINGNPVTNLDEVEKEITDSLKNHRSLTLKILTGEGTVGYYELQ
jgi:Do/DeqQ family serine protease